MAAGNLDTKDKLASVAGLAVACAALILSAVSLRLQLRDQAKSRRSDAQLALGHSLSALHAAAGRPEWRRLRVLEDNQDGPLHQLSNREFKSVLAGSSADWSTTRAVVEVLTEYANSRRRPIAPEMRNIDEWRKGWSTAAEQSVRTSSRHWLIGIATALIAVGLMNIAIFPASPKASVPDLAEQLVVGKGQRLTPNGAMDEVRLRVALANSADDDRTVNAIRILDHIHPGNCGGVGRFHIFELSTALTLTTIDRDTFHFIGEVADLRAESRTVPPAADVDTMRLPAKGYLVGAYCGGEDFSLSFDVVVVLPAHTTTTVEIRLPERLDVLNRRTPDRVMKRAIGFPGFSSVEAVDSDGRSIIACRGDLPDHQRFLTLRSRATCFEDE